MMHEHAAGLGYCGIEQVGAHGNGWLEAEQEYQQWRHQRTATNTGDAYQQAHCKTRGRIQQIHNTLLRRGAHYSSGANAELVIYSHINM